MDAIKFCVPCLKMCHAIEYLNARTEGLRKVGRVAGAEYWNVFIFRCAAIRFWQRLRYGGVAAIDNSTGKWLLNVWWIDKIF